MGMSVGKGVGIPYPVSSVLILMEGEKTIIRGKRKNMHGRRKLL
jgi:hypothetical protein